MIVTHKIEMDLLSKTETVDTPRIHVVQGDCNTRVVAVALSAGKTEWNIPEGVSVQMRYRKPDGTGGVYDTLPDGTQAWSAEANVVSVTLAPQMLTVAGLVRGQIAMIREENCLATFEVHIAVEEDMSANVLTSEDYTNMQMWLSEELQEALSEAKASGTFDGATFVPSVSASGVLSWSNNKGLKNPASVNINAPQGILPVANGGTGAATAATARTNLGAAPAGYGYGEIPVSLGSADDDTAFTTALNEQFAKTVSKTRQVRFTWGGGAWVGTLWNAGNNYGVLTAYSYAVQNVGFVIQKVVRNCVDGTWQDWEYENPPMKAGVEYRTTERYLGKVVYAKLITGKALAVADTTVGISLGVTGITNLVDFAIMHKGNSSSVYTFPSHGLYSGEPMLTGYFNIDNGAFTLQTHQDLSAHTASVFAKYTKD